MTGEWLKEAQNRQRGRETVAEQTATQKLSHVHFSKKEDDLCMVYRRRDPLPGPSAEPPPYPQQQSLTGPAPSLEPAAASSPTNHDTSLFLLEILSENTNDDFNACDTWQ